MMARYVVVGGGIAGVSCAEQVSYYRGYCLAFKQPEARVCSIMYHFNSYHD